MFVMMKLRRRCSVLRCDNIYCQALRWKAAQPNTPIQEKKSYNLRYLELHFHTVWTRYRSLARAFPTASPFLEAVPCAVVGRKTQTYGPRSGLHIINHMAEGVLAGADAC